MRALIIEDEPRTARRLERMMSELRPDIEICGPLPSIESATSWFDRHSAPDLVFMDVELEDGTAFELLERIGIAAPIIFCTAFSNYALQAFRSNSIDYLLKPVSLRSLGEALARAERFRDLHIPPEAWSCLRGAETKPCYRERFLVPRRKAIEIVTVDAVIAVTSWHKASRLLLTSGEDRMVDASLKEVAATLDPAVFFQISRQTVVRLTSVTSIARSAGHHAVQLAGESQSFPVSRSRVAGLKSALGAGIPR